MNTNSCQASSSPLLSSHEISRAEQYLTSTRDNLVNAVAELDDPQWQFKPTADAWSILDIVEHLAIIEDRAHAVVGRMIDAPRAEPDRRDCQVDEFILAEVPGRSTKVQAPPQASPLRQWSPAEALDRFLESRSGTLRLLVEAPCLRGHILPHPIHGPWDGYQWILAVAAHTARHTQQILEWKASFDFPETRSSASMSLD